MLVPILLGALLLLQLLILVLLWWRGGAGSDALRLEGLLDAWQDAQDGRSERLARDLRGELAESARGTRLELGSRLADFQRTLLAQSGEALRSQNEQVDTLRVQLAAMQQAVTQSLSQAGALQAQQAQAAREALDAALQRFAAAQTEQWRLLGEANDRRLGELRSLVEQRLAGVQASVEGRLQALQADNEKRLEQMRATVDEKLHATLETRLGESFRQVAERLEQVHRGLGEMQTLAQGVGDLKRVLGNVKTRGVFGEVQLAALLEQVFTPQQYALNVATVPGSRERVEFAIRLPGRGATGSGAGPAGATGDDETVWLPLDAKFPREDYERLLDAQDRADREGAEAAARALEQRVRDEARSIATKYLAPPHTTDFAVLFVPTEGLYAELLRRPGLAEALQRQHRVTLAGPTTLLALLNSLQMGFRTLALERRSAEVWQVLGAVKTEFGRFGEVLEKTRRKLQEAGHTIEAAEVRTRAMARQLRGVEALEPARADALLGLAEGGAVSPTAAP
ncbi:MAG: DNA recombination protein RmuC [Burkholderiaceae bacterium]|nr:DNA recombination protein RmuC [Burkholderiaceae bacterium]